MRNSRLLQLIQSAKSAAGSTTEIAIFCISFFVIPCFYIMRLISQFSVTHCFNIPFFIVLLFYILTFRLHTIYLHFSSSKRSQAIRNPAQIPHFITMQGVAECSAKLTQFI